MDTKIFFRCGGESLVIKFHGAPTLTIADDNRIILSNVGNAYIHCNSSDNWEDYFEFCYSKDGILMEVTFKVKANYLKIKPFLFTFQSDFLITGHNENGDEI